MRLLSGALSRNRERLGGGGCGWGGVELERYKANHYGHYGKGVLSDKRVQYIKVLHNHLSGYNRP